MSCEHACVCQPCSVRCQRSGHARILCAGNPATMMLVSVLEIHMQRQHAVHSICALCNLRTLLKCENDGLAAGCTCNCSTSAESVRSVLSAWPGHTFTYPVPVLDLAMDGLPTCQDRLGGWLSACAVSCCSCLICSTL